MALSDLIAGLLQVLGGPDQIIDVRVYRDPGVIGRWEKPIGATEIRVCMVTGGGGGGAGNHHTPGDPGADGEVVIARMSADSLPDHLHVTVGRGGRGGRAPGCVPGMPGGDGIAVVVTYGGGVNREVDARVGVIVDWLSDAATAPVLDVLLDELASIFTG